MTPEIDPDKLQKLVTCNALRASTGPLLADLPGNSLKLVAREGFQGDGKCGADDEIDQTAGRPAHSSALR